MHNKFTYSLNGYLYSCYTIHTHMLIDGQTNGWMDDRNAFNSIACNRTPLRATGLHCVIVFSLEVVWTHAHLTGLSSWVAVLFQIQFLVAKNMQIYSNFVETIN